MKRARRMTTSRTSSGSGPAFPASQEVMAQPAAPEQLRGPPPTAKVEAGGPSGLSDQGPWVGMLSPASRRAPPCSLRSRPAGQPFPPDSDWGLPGLREDRAGRLVASVVKRPVRHSCRTSRPWWRQCRHCPEAGGGHGAPSLPAAPGADVICKPRRGSCWAKLAASARPFQRPTPALPPARQSGPFSPQLAITSGGRRGPSSGSSRPGGWGPALGGGREAVQMRGDSQPSPPRPPSTAPLARGCAPASQRCTWGL